MRQRRLIRRASGGATRATEQMTEHVCESGLPDCEIVLAPASVKSVLCSVCVQRKAGRDALPPPPLTKTEKMERFQKFLADKRASKRKAKE